MTTYALIPDAENHLVSMSGPDTASFVYDADGQRISRTINGATTYYVGNYYEVAPVPFIGSVTTKYYFANGQRIAMRRNGTLTWMFSDHLGSISVTATAAGVYASEKRYKPWGEDRWSYNTALSGYQFTGQFNETSLGIYYYNARYYDTYITWVLLAFPGILTNPKPKFDSFRLFFSVKRIACPDELVGACPDVTCPDVLVGVVGVIGVIGVVGAFPLVVLPLPLNPCFSDLGEGRDGGHFSRSPTLTWVGETGSRLAVVEPSSLCQAWIISTASSTVKEEMSSKHRTPATLQNDLIRVG